MQLLETSLARVVSDHGELLEDHSLEGFFRRTAWLALQSAILHAADELVTLRVTDKKTLLLTFHDQNFKSKHLQMLEEVP